MDSFGYYKYGSNESAELVSIEKAGGFSSPCGYYHIDKPINVASVQIQASNPIYTTQIYTYGGINKKYKNADSITINTKSLPVYAIVTPEFVQIQTNGPKMDRIISYKGPRVSIMAENTSTEGEIGTVPTNVNAFKLDLATGQFISLKIDINGATASNLPSGFVFSSGEIKGAAKAAGTYKFNIVSSSTTIPVTFVVSDLIRIA